MLNRLSIRFRLNAALALLALLLAITGTIGVIGMRASDANINEVYTNQLASASLMGKAQLNAAIVRTTLDRAVFHPDAADVPAIIERPTLTAPSLRGVEAIQGAAHERGGSTPGRRR